MRDYIIKVYKYGDSQAMVCQVSDEKINQIKPHLDNLCRLKGYHYSIEQGFSVSDVLDLLEKDKDTY